MEKVRVEEAIGMVLAHDMTKIIPDVYKGVAFKKGHVVQEKDIEMLKSMGKDHIFIFRKGEDDLHEEEAAQRIAQAVSGEGVYQSEPAEGKVSIKAGARGLLQIDVPALEAINEIEGLILSTLHRYTIVEADRIVAGTKIIPLIIDKSRIEAVEEIAAKHRPVISVKPFKPLKVGIVVTGSEVFYGRIQDAFAPVLRKKAAKLGGRVMDVLFAPDDEVAIRQAIETQLDNGAQLVMVSGGMSVDPDDMTPKVIAQMAQVVTYGSPVLPGAMFMTAYRGDIPILGIPACGMYNKITVLDLILPLAFAGERVTKQYLTSLSHGGLCMQCDVCHYPICPFGKS